MTDFHVTQDVVEALTTSLPDLRVTQHVVEVLSTAPTSVQVTQSVIEVLASVNPGSSGGGPNPNAANGMAHKHLHTDENGAIKVVAVTPGVGTGPLTPFAHVICTTDTTGALRMAPITLNPPLGPFTDLSNLRVCTDETSALLVAINPAGSLVGPLTNLGNLRVRTDARGALVVVSPAPGSLNSAPSPFLNLRGRTDENGALVVSGLASQTYAQAVVGDGASHYWPLSETSGLYIDAVGGLNGTLTGTVQRGVPGAVTGSTAVRFIDVASAGKITLPVLSLTPPFTIECWIKTAFIGSASPAILVTNRTAGQSGNPYLATINTGSVIQFGPNTAPMTGAISINNNQWHYVVCTTNGTQSTIYIDSVLDTQQAFTIASASDVGSIGWDNFAGFIVDHAIDELAFYPFLLSPAQMAAHYAFHV